MVRHLISFARWPIGYIANMYFCFVYSGIAGNRLDVEVAGQIADRLSLQDGVQDQWNWFVQTDDGFKLFQL